MLTKIHVAPIYYVLQTVKGKLKVKASLVPIDLGGEPHGYLGLVLTPIKYAAVRAVPYVTPLHLGVLNVPL